METTTPVIMNHGVHPRSSFYPMIFGLPTKH